MEKSLLPDLIDSMLVEAENSFNREGTITDTVLTSLHGVFGKILRNALQLIDSNSVTLLRVKDNAVQTELFIFQVLGSNNSSYLLFYQTNYCQCKFYEKKIIPRVYPACKHYIAANLAYIWKKYRTYDIDFEAYKETLKSISSPTGVL